MSTHDQRCLFALWSVGAMEQFLPYRKTVWCRSDGELSGLIMGCPAESLSALLRTSRRGERKVAREKLRNLNIFYLEYMYSLSSPSPQINCNPQCEIKLNSQQCCFETSYHACISTITTLYLKNHNTYIDTCMYTAELSLYFVGQAFCAMERE